MGGAEDVVGLQVAMNDALQPSMTSQASYRLPNKKEDTLKRDILQNETRDFLSRLV